MNILSTISKASIGVGIVLIGPVKKNRGQIRPLS